MSTKSSAAVRRSTEFDQNHMQSQAQHQFANFTEKAASLFREIEAVQQVQQHSAQRTALKLEQATEQLRGSTSPTELLSIQSSLMMGGMQEMAQFMQEISVTMMRMQVAFVPKLPSGNALEGVMKASGADAASATASPMNGAFTAADAASAATAAVFQSWSNMLGGGLTPNDARSSH